MVELRGILDQAIILLIQAQFRLHGKDNVPMSNRLRIAMNNILNLADLNRHLHSLFFSTPNHRLDSVTTQMIEIERKPCILKGKVTNHDRNNDLE